MNLALKPNLEHFVAQQVLAGRYASAEDVVAAGLARLMQRDDFDFEPGELAALAREGEEAIARGETVTLEQMREHFHLRGAQVKADGSQSDSPPLR